MAEIDGYVAGSIELIGEIEAPKLRMRTETDIPVEIWPGKFTDIASLERNAEAWRRLERRRAVALFFKRLLRRR